MYACLYQPPAPDQPPDAAALLAIAQEFSPRYERHRHDLVSIDVSGLERLLGPARMIGDELRREAGRRGMRVHVAVAPTCMSAILLAHARPGLTVAAFKNVAEALAPIPIGILEKIHDDRTESSRKSFDRHVSAISAFKRWGLRTLGELAALPPAGLAARLGRPAAIWQAIARGEDVRPLVPAVADERFDASLELEWPIEGLDPLSFVLTRLLEPLSTRLERRDRGAAVLHVELRLVTKTIHARSLQLPSPIRDVRTLRTLALVDLKSHPPDAAVDRVAIVIDPTPGRIVQHTLFSRAHPTPEQLSTLVARLGALMGQDRIGAAATVDSFRPGAFEMRPFKTEQGQLPAERESLRSSARSFARGGGVPRAISNDSRARLEADAASRVQLLTSSLRRCRQSIPARVALAGDRPVRVTTDRRGFAGGAVLACAGPWRTSGDWWSACGPREAPGPPTRHPRWGGSPEGSARSAPPSASEREPSAKSAGGGAPAPEKMLGPASIDKSRPWNRDEWDVSLGDGGVYRIFRDRETDRWFIDAIVD